ncbi:CPBP family intramembrane glutamic endopeptidase [Paenibacillus glacialis]|uniref:CAAX protease n=1 Tax=Paenibacillus glacialis TaxID=494026 RepID=A0A168KZ72_9BACL|nr:type II CAAX endopeptidase family protein [Paenibacillus glacialis]OAB42665.1 CAAX protease [Paenibacillus glacialis]
MRTVLIFAKSLLYLIIYAGIVMVMNQAIYNWITQPELKTWFNNNPASIFIIANLIVLALYVPLQRLQRISFADLGFVPPKSLMVSAGAGLSLGLFIASFSGISWIKDNYPEISNLVTFIIDGGHFLVILFGSILLGSLLEEWLFRGLLLHLFRERFSTLLSVLLQAVFFGAVFMNITVGLFAALGAVIYGVIRVSTGSLWSSLITHMISTTSLYVVSLFIKEWSSGTVVALTIISGLALLAHIFVLLFRSRRLPQNKQAAGSFK